MCKLQIIENEHSLFVGAGNEDNLMARVAKAKNTEVSLETVLWNCRVALRGIGSTEKNRDAVIGLVFLKFAGDKFEKDANKLRKSIKMTIQNWLKFFKIKCLRITQKMFSI